MGKTGSNLIIITNYFGLSVIISDQLYSMSD